MPLSLSHLWFYWLVCEGTSLGWVKVPSSDNKTQRSFCLIFGKGQVLWLRGLASPSCGFIFATEVSLWFFVFSSKSWQKKENTIKCQTIPSPSIFLLSFHLIFNILPNSSSVKEYLSSSTAWNTTTTSHSLNATWQRNITGMKENQMCIVHICSSELCQSLFFLSCWATANNFNLAI